MRLECGVRNAECGMRNPTFKPNGTKFRLIPRVRVSQFKPEGEEICLSSEEAVILWKHGPIIPAVWALAPDNGGSSVASAKTARKITAPKGRSDDSPRQRLGF